MPRKIDKAVKQDAITLAAQGKTQDQASFSTNMSTRTLQRAKAKLIKHGDIEGGEQKRGPKGKLDDAMTNVLFYSLMHSSTYGLGPYENGV